MNERISLELYDVFVAVAEARSLTEAAKRLRTTKATVSRALARLEEELGTELVHRSTRSMSLSTAGAALYEQIASNVVALRDASLKLYDDKDAPRGTLRITAPVDLGQHILPDVLALYSQRYPGIRVEARVTDQVLDLVADGIDVALRISTGPQRDSTLTSRKIGVVAVGCYASPAYIAKRGAPKKLGDDTHDWLVHSTLRRGLPKSLQPHVVTDDMVLLRELAMRGAGIAFLAQFVAAPAVIAGTLARVLADAETIAASISLVFPSSGQVARKVEVFRDVVIEAMRARPLPS